MKALALAAMILGAQAAPVRALMTCKTIGNATSCEAAGNLAPTQDRGCIALDDADATMSPADLAVSAQACAEADRGAGSAELMALMLERGRFDAGRVTDRTAHQAIKVLLMQIGSALPSGKAKAAENTLHDLIANVGSPEFSRFCARMTTLGTSRHDPSYRIAHGTMAVSEDGTDPLVPGFDGKAAWDKVLRDHMKCSG